MKNGSTIHVKYTYDALSRRIATVIDPDNTAVTTLYVYDGWNIIAEYAGTSLAKTYIWGMDLSGSMQGAGGVGGLLAVTHGTTTYYPTFDGNGNVSEYLTNGGAVAAHFEYDPFGNLTADTNSNAASFPYRFSTKPQDPETGFYYYGYRWYDPVTGRWPSRDPIEERGGLNLYAMVGNDGINWWDYLGMVVIKQTYSRAKFSHTTKSGVHETALHELIVNVDTSDCGYPTDSLPCDPYDGTCMGDIKVSAQLETTRPGIITTSLTLAINDSGFVLGEVFHPVTGPKGGKPGSVYSTGMVDIGSIPCSSLGLCWVIPYTYKTRDGEVLIGLSTSYVVTICVQPTEECGKVKTDVSMTFVNGGMKMADKTLGPISGPSDPKRPEHTK